MTDTEVLALVNRVRVAIPVRPVPPPKPQLSWHTLKVGDVLIDDGTNQIATITTCTNLGITLSAEEGGYFNWSDPDWRAHFTKLPKRRTPKKDTNAS